MWALDNDCKQIIHTAWVKIEDLDKVALVGKKLLGCAQALSRWNTSHISQGHSKIKSLELSLRGVGSITGREEIL